MPQFFDFSEPYEPKRYRDGMSFHGLDMSEESDLWELDDAREVGERALHEHGQRVQQWIEDNHLWDPLAERLSVALRAAGQAAETAKLREKLMQGLAGLAGLDGDHAPISTVLTPIDPVFLAFMAERWGKELSNAAEHLHSIIVNFGSFDPGIVAWGEQALRRLAPILVRVSMLRDLFFERMLERVAHGIPEWDNERGVEKELEPGLPAMGAMPGQPDAPEVQEQTDAIFQRLMSGWDGWDGDQAQC